MFNKSNWTKKEYNELLEYLNNSSDEKYKIFTQKLIPNIEAEKFIGIRIPYLRKIAKEISKGNYIEFLNINKNYYFEETMLEGLVIGNINNSLIAEKYIKRFIPKINNWSICDSFCNSLKIVNTNKEYYLNFFKKYINKNNEYETRCALTIFLNYYIDEKYIKDIFEIVDNIKSNYYYTNMAIAWLISMCYIKYPNKTLKYIINSKLDIFTYNKTIQKIIESNRIDKKTKEILRKLKK